VGKTSLMNQYVNKKFTNQYKAKPPRGLGRLAASAAYVVKPKPAVAC